MNQIDAQEIKMYVENVNIKNCSVRMEEPDVALVDHLRKFVEETEGYQASRSEFLYFLIKKAMWQIIIEEKEKMGEVYAFLDKELTYAGFLRNLLGEDYSPRYLVDIPVYAMEDGEDPDDALVEDMSRRLIILLKSSHPLIVESDIANKDWYSGKYNNWVEEKIGDAKSENE